MKTDKTNNKTTHMHIFVKEKQQNKEIHNTKNINKARSGKQKTSKITIKEK